MKLLNKIKLALTAFCLALLFIAASSVTPHHAYAAMQSSQDDECFNSLTFVNIATITCQVSGVGTLKFVDNDPSDNTVNYRLVSKNPFCNSDPQILSVGKSGGEGGKLNLSDAGQDMVAGVKFGYTAIGVKGCQTYNPSPAFRKVAGSQNISKLLQGGDNSVSTISGVTKKDLSGLSYSRFNNGALDPNSNVALFVSGVTDLGVKCSGHILAVYIDSVSGGKGTGTTAIDYEIGSSGQSIDNGFDNLANVSSQYQASGCGVTHINYDLGGSQSNPQTFDLYNAVSGIPISLSGTTCTAGDTSKPGFTCQCTPDGGHTTCSWVSNATDPGQVGNSANGEKCEANSSGFSFAWAVCPVLDAASSLTNSLVGLFEGQLSFRVTDLSQTGQDKIHISWAVIRDVASSVLVVIMLIMVLSQAINIGPFDAYTVKKLLPKLVIAVLVMQISWDLFGWAVNLTDDIGHGLSDLMYLPFGGPNNMSLWALLSNGHISTGQAAALDWGAVPLVLFLGYAFIFTMLGTATTAILALLSGLFTLIFRKILIIMLLMLSPLALVCWILPGTQNYWKMWRENLTKALLMYPLVVGLIASGRIFAWVAGTQKDVAHGGTFLNLIFILVGFFGPMFLLPKCFKWGGQAMQLAGNAASKAGSKIGERPKKFFDKRQEGWSREQSRRSQERVSGKAKYGKWFKVIPNKPVLLPLDRLKSGKWDPTLGGPGNRMRFEQLAKYAEAGRKSSGETFEAARAYAQQIFDTAADHDQVAWNMFKGGEFEYIDTQGNVQKFVPPKGPGGNYMKAAGAAGILKYGTDKGYHTLEAQIDRLRASENSDDRLLAQEILDDNVDKWKGRNDSVYRGFRRDKYDESKKAAFQKKRREDMTPQELRQVEQDAIREGRYGSYLSSVDSMNEGWFQDMEGTTAQSYLAALSHGVANGDTNAEAMMRKLWSTYEEAINSPNIHIKPGVHKAFKAYADDNIYEKQDVDADGRPVFDASGQPVMKTVSGREEINDQRENKERESRVRGEVVDKVTGKVEWKNDVDENRSPLPSLDVIVNKDANNQRIIKDLHADDLMAGYDANGSPVNAQSHAAAAVGTTNGSNSGPPRWQQAQEVLSSASPGRPLLTRAQQRAVQSAHEIGEGEVGRNGDPAGVGNYTDAQLRQKAEILKAAGFSQPERRILVERGIVGSNDAAQSVTTLHDSEDIESGALLVDHGRMVLSDTSGSSGSIYEGGSSRQSAPVKVVTAPQAAASATTQAGQISYAAPAAAPEVNVNIDSEAIGQSVASNMRNVLQHTKLRVENVGGENTATNIFSPNSPGGNRSESSNERPPVRQPVVREAAAEPVSAPNDFGGGGASIPHSQ